MFWSKKNVSPEQQKIVDNLRNVLGDKDFNLLKNLIEDELKNPPKVAIIGKAGVGKSTTINALFNLNEKISHTTHGTTEASKKVVELPKGGKLSIIDMPGMGEDLKLDQEYAKIYERILPEADIVLYVIQANLKALREDQIILRDIVQNVMGNLKGRLVIGLNQVDKIGPGTWNTKFNFPSPEQEDNINRRCQAIQKELSSVLSIKVEQVEYYSAEKRYRLYDLLGAIIKSSGNTGWKFAINPADPVELADESVQDLLRKELER
jgi:small GTP-binding protein